jgi:tRNA threonylcarbamoyladenosine biosynthesis protein TsaE
MTRAHLHTPLLDETALTAWAGSFGACLRPGDVLALEGTLGAGKSAFARAAIRTRLDDPSLAVASPTFTLVQHYTHTSGDIYHADLHRLDHPAEMEELGLDAALSRAITIIEWPELAAHWLPPHYIHLAFSIPTNTPLLRRIDMHCLEADTARFKGLTWSH